MSLDWLFGFCHLVCLHGCFGGVVCFRLLVGFVLCVVVFVFANLIFVFCLIDSVGWVICNSLVSRISFWFDLVLLITMDLVVGFYVVFCGCYCAGGFVLTLFECFGWVCWDFGCGVLIWCFVLLLECCSGCCEFVVELFVWSLFAGIRLGEFGVCVFVVGVIAYFPEVLLYCRNFCCFVY